MKDKLVKNHHKGIYYRSRRILVGTAVAMCVGFMVAVPTYITINQREQLRVKAQDDEVVEDENKNEQDGGLDNLESFTEDE